MLRENEQSAQTPRQKYWIRIEMIFMNTQLLQIIKEFIMQNIYRMSVYWQIVWIYADIGNNIKIHGCENRRRQFKCLVGHVNVGSVFLCAINFMNVGTVHGVNTAGAYITLITNAITVMLVAQWAETHCWETLGIKCRA